MSFSLLQESQFHHSHCSGVAELLLTTTLRRKKKKNSAHRLAWPGLGTHSSSHHQLAWNSLLHYCTAVLQAKHTSRTVSKLTSRATRSQPPSTTTQPSTLLFSTFLLLTYTFPTLLFRPLLKRAHLKVWRALTT